MEHSKLERENKKLLCILAERLLKGGFNPNDPFDDIRYTDPTNLLGEISRTFLGKNYDSYLDVDFMGKLEIVTTLFNSMKENHENILNNPKDIFKSDYIEKLEPKKMDDLVKKIYIILLIAALHNFELAC